MKTYTYQTFHEYDRACLNFYSAPESLQVSTHYRSCPSWKKSCNLSLQITTHPAPILPWFGAPSFPPRGDKISSQWTPFSSSPLLSPGLPLPPYRRKETASSLLFFASMLIPQFTTRAFQQPVCLLPVHPSLTPPFPPPSIRISHLLICFKSNFSFLKSLSMKPAKR